MNRTTRRGFLLSTFTAAAGAFIGTACAPNRGTDSTSVIEYCIPAADMRERVNAFRAEFVTKYLQTNSDFPFYEMLAKGKMLPINNNHINTLLRRDKFSVEIVPGEPQSRLLRNSDAGASPMFAALAN